MLPLWPGGPRETHSPHPSASHLPRGPPGPSSYRLRLLKLTVLRLLLGFQLPDLKPGPRRSGGSLRDTRPLAT